MLEKYWEKGISFEEYIYEIERKTQCQSIMIENSLKDKYIISLKRARDILKTYIPDKKQQERINQKNFNGKILVIAEGWCGDCSQSIPIIQKFFGEINPVRILHRDKNPELMHQFLTNGSQSVPVVILLDKEDNIVGRWGPRTKHGVKLLKKFKEDPDSYPREVFLSELHEYYDRNKGFDIVEEILELL